MDQINRSTYDETQPTVEETIFVNRFLSGSVCAAEISRWLKVSPYVRDTLASIGFFESDEA